MANNPIQIDTDEVGRMSSVLRQDISLSTAATAEERTRIGEWRKFYKDQSDDEPMFPGASVFVSPFVKESTFALLSEVCPALLNVVPIIHVEAQKQYKAVADAWEDFYQALYVQHLELAPLVQQWYYGGFRDSGSILSATWRTEKENVWSWKKTKSGWEAVLAEQMVFDWPDLNLIPLDQFGVIPAQQAEIQKAAGVYHSHTVSAAWLMQGVKNNEFNKAATYELIDLIANTSGQQSPEDVSRDIAATTPSIQTKEDKIKQPFTITEVYLKYRPSSTSPMGDWLFTLHEDSSTVLRAKPTPWWHGLRPFAQFSPYINCEGIYRDSVASMGAGHVQKAKSDIITLSINCMRRGIDPRTLIPASLYKEIKDKFGLDLFKKAGALIPFPDSYFQQGRTMQPLIPGYNPNQAIPLSEYLDNDGGKTIGVSDNNKNAANQNGITATEAQIMLEGSKKLLGSITENGARALVSMQKIVHGLVYQFQGHESVQQLWQEVNGDTGIPFEFALEVPLTFAANGLSETSNQAIRAQRATQRYQILQNEPRVMMNDARRHALEVSTLQALGDRTPEDILGTAEEWQQEAAQQAQQAPPQQSSQPSPEEKMIGSAMQAMGSTVGKAAGDQMLQQQQMQQFVQALEQMATGGQVAGGGQMSPAGQPMAAGGVQ